MAEFNGVMMQCFHWYTPADGSLWKQLAGNASELAGAGFTALWLPPAYKGANGANDVGYGVYDLFDLGEFDQKGSVLTKYGSRDQYLAADYYGAHYIGAGNDGNEYEIHMTSHKWMIDNFIHARKSYAWGDQYDYFDHPNCAGWTRTGNEENPGGMAVLLSNGDDGKKFMETGSPDTEYVDITGHMDENVTTNNDGWGEFCCKGGSVSVWVPK